MVVWLICDVDTEFDYLRFNGKEPKYQNDPGLTKGVPKLLDFFDKYNIQATFHIQEQAGERQSIFLKYPTVYEEIEKHNQEIGLHVHVKESDYNSRKLEIGAGFQRLKEQGYQISTFKAGWYFTNENSIRVLEELGIKYDCSPHKNSVVGDMRWYDIPDSPYHPSYKDMTKPGDSEVLVIPITNSRLGIAIHENNDYELLLMKKGAETLIKESEKIKQPVIIYFTTHSWKSIGVSGSSFRDWEQKRRGQFFDFLSQYDIKSLNVRDAGSLWEKKGFEPYFLKLPDLVGSYRPFYNPLRYFWLVKHIFSRVYTYKYKLLGGV